MSLYCFLFEKNVQLSCCGLAFGLLKEGVKLSLTFKLNWKKAELSYVVCFLFLREWQRCCTFYVGAKVRRNKEPRNTYLWVNKHCAAIIINGEEGAFLS